MKREVKEKKQRTLPVRFLCWTLLWIVFGCSSCEQTKDEDTSVEGGDGSTASDGDSYSDGNSDADAGADTGTDGDPDTDAGADTGTDSNPKPDSASGTDTGTDTGSGPDIELGDTDGWGNVRFDGGGFVDGVIASTKVKGLFYARTDVGGVYRWNDTHKVWIPLMDWISQDDVGLYGAESVALDPNNPGRLYVLAGTKYFSDGKTAILRSEDYGETFESTDVTSLWGAHGNGMGRQTGEKLAVDPNNPDILFCGSRTAGLFKSNDAGKSWTHVCSIGSQPGADLVYANGISFVLFDTSSSLTAAGGTSTIFMGVSVNTENLYVSNDGGDTFTAIAGGPSSQMPNRAVLSDGNLYITFCSSLGPHSVSSGSFYKYSITSDSWTNLTPRIDDGTGYMGNGGQGAAHGFGGVSVDPTDPDHIVISTLNYYGGQTRYEDGGEGWGDRIYITTDGGITWTTNFSYQDPSNPANANASVNGNAWISGKAIHWAGDITFDPFDTKQAWVVST